MELQWEPVLLPRERIVRWALVSGHSLSVSLIDSERALDLLQVHGGV
jgi:hypothetical protein